jgi:hypothetical protein
LSGHLILGAGLLPRRPLLACRLALRRLAVPGDLVGLRMSALAPSPVAPWLCRAAILQDSLRADLLSLHYP